MFFKYRLDNKRIVVISPDPILSYEQETHGVVEVDDVVAYEDINNVYKVNESLDGIEIDSTYTPPEWDFGVDEVRALCKLIVDQLNVLRGVAGLPEITYDQAKTVIKQELGL